MDSNISLPYCTDLLAPSSVVSVEGDWGKKVGEREGERGVEGAGEER